MVPKIAPGRPGVRVGSGARGGPATVTVAWTKPATTGGARVRGYRIVAVTATGRTVVRTVRVGAAARSASVELPRGSYRIRVNARNQVGHGTAAVSRSVRAR